MEHVSEREMKTREGNGSVLCSAFMPNIACCALLDMFEHISMRIQGALCYQHPLYSTVVMKAQKKRSVDF